jgi:hypothetical protein
MTNEEINKVAAKLAAACDECDAGRLSERDFGRMLDRAYAGKSSNELMRIHIAMARCQGRDVAAISSDDEIVGSSDLAESFALRTLGKQH